jgi:hypothetical protein
MNEAAAFAAKIHHMKTENNLPQATQQEIIAAIPAKFIFHEDAGHGWLQVPLKLLTLLNLAAQITGCSYRSADSVFLEEDLDMATFLKAYFSFRKMPYNQENYRYFFMQKVESTYKDNSEVRNLPRY